MLDIDSQELLVLLVVALVILGPERLPEYAAQFARWVRQVRDFAVSARSSVRAEMGPEFDEVDWQALDPRRYDPRRIVREALLDGEEDPLGLRKIKSDTARLLSDDFGDEAPAATARTATPPAPLPRRQISQDAPHVPSAMRPTEAAPPEVVESSSTVDFDAT